MKERLKFNKSGQWALEKWDDEDVKQAEKWSESGLRHHLNTLPEAKGDTRVRMMNALHDDLKMWNEHPANPKKSKTPPVRIGKDGATEYLLHRSAPKDKFHEKNLTSWTTSAEWAHSWGDTQNSGREEEEKRHGKSSRAEDQPHHVMSAWIPEHQIHSYLQPIAEDHDWEKHETEVIVKPHKANIVNAAVPYHEPSIRMREKHNAEMAVAKQATTPKPAAAPKAS